MDEQQTDQIEASAADDDNKEDERHSTGIKKVDETVYKIDAGVRKIDAGVRAISKELHAPPPPEDPARPRVSIGVEPIDNAVYKIDDGVRRISTNLHKAVDAVKKQ